MSFKQFFTKANSKLFKKEVSNVGQESKIADHKADYVYDKISSIMRKALTQFPYVIYVLVVSICLSFCIGYATGNRFQRSAEVVTVVTGSDPFKEGVAESIPSKLPTETPVVIGNRIQIKRDYAVKDSTDVLNCIQAIGGREYKINFSDRYYSIGLTMPRSLAFVLHNAEEADTVYTQFVFGMNALTDEGIWGSLLEGITEEALAEYLAVQFVDVSDIKVEDDYIAFKAGDIQLSGYFATFDCENGEKFAILSMQEETTAPDEYCRNYLSSMLQTVGPYYNQMYPKPTEIDGEVIDKSAYIQGQNVLLCTPRSGFDITVNTSGYSILEMHNTEVFGNSLVLLTTSQQDIYGFFEAMERVSFDIASAYDALTKTTGNIYNVDTKEIADWSNVEAYYMEGSIGTKRVVTYVYFNPIHNNYSTISAIVERDDLGVNGERLVNAMSERIEFVGEKN